MGRRVGAVEAEVCACCRQAQHEVADLKGVLSDLAVKVEELEGAVRENESTRNALKAAFSRLTAAQVGACLHVLNPYSYTPAPQTARGL